MDDIVKQALAKWPHVPHCTGWLGLDARGNWWMRDALAQACGAFASGQPGAKGSLLQHEGLIAFIARNYEPDAAGQWFFQNGPQRVYVELERTPWVWRIAPDGVTVHAHTGQPAGLVRGLYCDEAGHVYLSTALGFGLIHSQDVPLAADAIETGRWTPPQDVHMHDLPARWHYVLSPQERQV